MLPPLIHRSMECNYSGVENRNRYNTYTYEYMSVLKIGCHGHCDGLIFMCFGWKPGFWFSAVVRCFVIWVLVEEPKGHFPDIDESFVRSIS